MGFSYRFPAVKGIQANQEYYIVMIPMKYLKTLFPDNDDIVLPEFRAQRRINEARIPEIKKYILDNRNSYVFSALSASIDGSFSFEPIGTNSIGYLEIDMDSVFLINDGQHRKAAIVAAMAEDASLGDETISIVLFRDKGLEKSQQMFTDLNKHAVKTSNSLSTLYDYRDSLAIATKVVVENVLFFNRYTDKEHDILGKNSSNFFTLSNIYKANQRIIHSNECDEDDNLFLIDYWKSVAANMIEWNEVLDKNLSKKDLRENYITTLAVTLNALGRLGRYFYDNEDNDMDNTLLRLKDVDWLRRSENWIGRTIRQDGKVMIGEDAVILTYIRIKQLIGLNLSRDEIDKEDQFRRSLA